MTADQKFEERKNAASMEADLQHQGEELFGGVGIERKGQARHTMQGDATLPDIHKFNEKAMAATIIEHRREVDEAEAGNDEPGLGFHNRHSTVSHS